MRRNRKIALGAFVFHSIGTLAAAYYALETARYQDAIACVLLGLVDLPLAPWYWFICDGLPISGRIGPYNSEVAAILASSLVFGGLFHAWAAVRLDRLIGRLLHR